MFAQLKLNLIPPSPVTDKIMLDIRGSICADSTDKYSATIHLYIDEKDAAHLLYSEIVEISTGEVHGIRTRFPTAGRSGNHLIILAVQIFDESCYIEQNLEILHSASPSIPLIGGAWAGLYHWSEQEGKLWNATLKKFTEHNWRELVRGMHECGMQTIVIQEVFRNQQYHGRHNIPKKGYHGYAFYPSKLFPERMEIETKDPIETILSECDNYQMHVFLGIGLYAWFDFTPASLKWHKHVMEELCQTYGNHASLYGWYISSEVPGSIHPSLINKPFQTQKKKQERIKQYQNEIIDFFRQLRFFANRFSPEMPIMLASNCHQLKGTESIYMELMQYLDILCPFGFHRMPKNDLTGEEAATFLQKICDAQHAHLWLDLEVFLFGSSRELYPREIFGLVDDLHRFSNFEKILCYQFPGLLNAPWAHIKPGGNATEKLYQDYMHYYQEYPKK